MAICVVRLFKASIAVLWTSIDISETLNGCIRRHLDSDHKLTFYFFTSRCKLSFSLIKFLVKKTYVVSTKLKNVRIGTIRSIAYTASVTSLVAGFVS